MAWAPPSWCKQVAADAPRAVVTLQSQTGEPRRHDLGDHSFYLLSREDTSADSNGERATYWHAAVLRDEHGACYLMDLKGSTGTFMNKKKLEPLRPERWEPGKVAVLGIPKLHDKATLEFIEHGSAKGQKRALKGADEPAAKRRQGADTAIPIDSSKSQGKNSKCDKCDGPHATDSCPHFKKARENHKDAWANLGSKGPRQLGNDGGKRYVLKHGREVRQPGDGSCLFHSLCFGLNGGQKHGHIRAGQLRSEIAAFVQRNSHLEIAGDTLEEWVRWDARCSVATYTRRMARGGWGGGIEMAACCLMKKVNVHVYERQNCGFERISCFDCPQRTKRTIHVLYQGGVHYDALVPCQ
eukprot:TRINITY_DN60195_c0_g1_i1.p1 TRINITY_DN60195_c0_g1~~TRINITY_DN60195_c0_g1_i1.p1  ORF type:complete len:354 (+),score=33.87 TRINITY_DN60195_c0_g1_i1:32-1093(+)